MTSTVEGGPAERLWTPVSGDLPKSASWVGALTVCRPVALIVPSKTNKARVISKEAVGNFWDISSESSKLSHIKRILPEPRFATETWVSLVCVVQRCAPQTFDLSANQSIVSWSSSFIQIVIKLTFWVLPIWSSDPKWRLKCSGNFQPPPR